MCVLAFSLLNFFALCAVSYILFVVSEQWWLGTLLTFAPRSPYLIPSVALVFASLFWHRGSLGINLISVLIVLVPIMGLAVPTDFESLNKKTFSTQTSLKIVSCNVQEFQPDFRKVMREIFAINPDVIALQEALKDEPLLQTQFPDWHVVHVGNFWIGSRYPVKLVTECQVRQFEGRLAGIVVEIDSPMGPVALSDIHQMTARRGLTELSRRSFVDGDGTKELEAFSSERYLEAIELRDAVDAARKDRPVIVVGDFNTPVSSNLFQKHWGDLQSSFDTAGFGFGYTSPCKGNRFWPDNTPWARIDHILCSNEWTVRRCQIGRSNGSDHRLIAALLEMRNPPAPTKQTSLDRKID
jgi:endonuclease/exonuclease/phosphatase family metal-dependent hydrolase